MRKEDTPLVDFSAYFKLQDIEDKFIYYLQGQPGGAPPDGERYCCMPENKEWLNTIMEERSDYINSFGPGVFEFPDVFDEGLVYISQETILVDGISCLIFGGNMRRLVNPHVDIPPRPKELFVHVYDVRPGIPIVYASPYIDSNYIGDVHGVPGEYIIVKKGEKYE